MVTADFCETFSIFLAKPIVYGFAILFFIILHELLWKLGWARPSAQESHGHYDLSVMLHKRHIL